ncbi:hypothetical protein FJZ18_04360 [Candidatus Pacearchaeota archaeon]|nr:hypothetical protein [Candidatus Pacearchaeota archaeon]
MHKIFHVLLGIVILFHWNRRPFWSNLPLINGAFFTYLALFGALFPDFAGLDAFNSLDTALHAIVGLSGLAVAFLEKK